VRELERLWEDGTPSDDDRRSGAVGVRLSLSTLYALTTYIRTVDAALKDIECLTGATGFSWWNARCRKILHERAASVRLAPVPEEK
jgi:hypothetical protein